jgi:hypothetical protein
VHCLFADVYPVGQHGFPVVDDVPSGQLLHTVDAVPPVPKYCFPAGQAVHAETED